MDWDGQWSLTPFARITDDLPFEAFDGATSTNVAEADDEANHFMAYYADAMGAKWQEGMKVVQLALGGGASGMFANFMSARLENFEYTGGFLSEGACVGLSTLGMSLFGADPRVTFIGYEDAGAIGAKLAAADVILFTSTFPHFRSADLIEVILTDVKAAMSGSAIVVFDVFINDDEAEETYLEDPAGTGYGLTETGAGLKDYRAVYVTTDILTTTIANGAVAKGSFESQAGLYMHYVYAANKAGLLGS